MRGAAIAFAFGAGLLMATPQGLAQARPSNDQLIGYFDLVVFGNETPGREALIVRKWKSPVLYKLGGISGAIAASRPALETHLATLSAFSNLKFEEIGPADPGEHLIIWLTDTARMREAGQMLAVEPADLVGTEDARCFFLSYFTDAGALTTARIVINVDNGQEVVNHCLLEEVTQSLGLPNDDPRIIPSIFNDQMQLQSLSFIDQVLVRLLYDPRIPAGASREAALQLARLILEELNPGG